MNPKYKCQIYRLILRSPNLYFFFSSCRCDSTEKLRNSLDYLRSVLNDATSFKLIYRYAFDFARVSVCIRTDDWWTPIIIRCSANMTVFGLMVACGCTSVSILFHCFFYVQRTSSMLLRDAAILGYSISLSAQQKYLLSWSSSSSFSVFLVWVVKWMELCWASYLLEPFDRANKVEETNK